jgi:hypothetical protein
MTGTSTLNRAHPSAALGVTPASSKTARDDRKYSVPAPRRLKSAADGDCAGQTVKPGRPWSASVVSNQVT